MDKRETYLICEHRVDNADLARPVICTSIYNRPDWGDSTKMNWQCNYQRLEDLLDARLAGLPICGMVRIGRSDDAQAEQREERELEERAARG